MRITTGFLSLAMLYGLSVSSYSQIQNPQVSPRVVAQISRTGQTASIPQRTLFVPEKDGLFRLSVYLVQTIATDNSTTNFLVSYTDDTGPEFQQFQSPPTVGCVRLGAPCSWTILLRANAGTPITWETDICQGCAPTYEIFATLEKLQPLQ